MEVPKSGSRQLIFGVGSATQAAEIAHLITAAFHSDTSGQVWLCDVRNDIINADGISSMMANPNIAFLTISEGIDNDDNGKTKLVAVCYVRHQPDNTTVPSWVGFVCVDPAKHGSGLGRQMLAYGEEYCQREFQVTKIGLNVISSKTELRSWYFRHGYREIGGPAKPFPYGETPQGILREGLQMVDYVKVLLE